LIVGDLGPAELARRLRGGGLRLRTGPVAVRINSALREVEQGVQLHYARHPLVADDAFIDFHVSVERPRSIRRWIEPQVVFGFDGDFPFAPLPGDQGFPMLEWGLNWCVSGHCHQFLIVHAAVLERDGRALLLPAPSGSGKSTLCAGLAYAGGWRLLSDELALLDLAGGLVWPLPRPVSLKNTSIDVIRALAPAVRFSAEVRETIKGRVAHASPPPGAVELGQTAARPCWVVLPRFAAGEPARLERLPKARAFMALMDNAFNAAVQGREGFLGLGRLIDGMDGFEFSYGDLTEAIAVFDRLARAPAGPGAA
jgi:HprK-related kinase A